MNHIMLVGIQGSGKGTQARKILDTYPDYTLFEMGGELRKFAQNGTPDGEHVASFLTQGLKVPNEYIIKMAKEFLEKNSGKNIIMDSVIRSKEQDEAIGHLFGKFDVFYFYIDEEAAVKRLCGRRIDPITQETFSPSFIGDTNPKTGNKLVVRADDTEESIRKRLAWSIADTLPLIQIWKDHGHTVYDLDASQSEEEIFAEIEKILE